MVAPVMRREYLGSWAASETKTGTFPMDAVNGYKIMSVLLYGAAADKQAWGQQTKVGEGGTPSAGVIPLAPVSPYVPGDLTGWINETTGEWSLTDGGTGVLNGFTDIYMEVKAEHPTLASDFYVITGQAYDYHVTPLVKRVAHTTLTNHGPDFLQLLQRENGCRACFTALLRDPDLYTGNSLMSQAIIKQRYRTQTALLHRVEELSGSARRWYAAQRGNEPVGYTYPGFTDRSGANYAHRPTSFNEASPAFPTGSAYVPLPLGVPDLPNAYARYTNTTYFPADTWQWWRFISTVVDDDIFLELLNAPHAEADNLDPNWVTTLTAWHRQGQVFPDPAIGDDAMGSPTTGSDNWNSVSPYALPPLKGLTGFTMWGQENAGNNTGIDSYRALKMPTP